MAAELGADMIGLIFYRRSPRFVRLPIAREIISELPPAVMRVGVFVNEPIESILRRAEQLRLDWVQLHGNESKRVIKSCQRSGLRVIKVFTVTSDFDRNYLLSSPADLVLVDNAGGGSGRTFDWQQLPKHPVPNLVLAGGINADNLKEGVEHFAPSVVDVNSGVESAPGVKSPRKLRDFMKICYQIRRQCY